MKIGFVYANILVGNDGFLMNQNEREWRRP